ncbi:MAG TPA: serine--tRNA ligase [Chloroflexota bacterium]|nr:serine--tRNA ligase [Chloroflexota bacterium]
MLSLSFIRENPDLVKKAVEVRRDRADIDGILRLDRERRELTTEADELRRERNESSRLIGRGEVTGTELDQLKARLAAGGKRIAELDGQLVAIEEQLNRLLLEVPNIPDSDVPIGTSEADNVEIKTWGEKRQFEFDPKPHDEIGRRLGIFETEAAVAMSGTRFHSLSGLGARLSRGLTQYMLDTQVRRHGFEEVYVPYLVKREAMVISAQLPKFEDDAYYLEREDMFLIPTGEVPLVNMLAGQTVAAARLPIKLTTASPCFRREAGAAGKDTRGLIRVHQYEKVEMVMFTEPDRSAEALQALLGYAEAVLQELELPYHVLEMNTSDLGFGQTKKYDPEVWMPAQGAYREISSCSNLGDFQSRRGNIRYQKPGEKPRLVHTLNASGLAVGRTIAALLENCQQVDGSVRLPDILSHYLEGETLIRLR